MQLVDVITAVGAGVQLSKDQQRTRANRFHLLLSTPGAREMRHSPWKTGGILGSLSGLLVAATAMYAAWEHNPQGEIYNESGIDFRYWLLLGFSWFVTVGAVVSLISGGLLTVTTRFRGKHAA